MPAFDARSFAEGTFDVDYSDLPILIGSIGDIIRTYGRPDASYKVLINSLKISDVADEVPNRATFTAMGFVPAVGDRIVFALGSLSNPERLFAGSILRVDNGYAAENPQHQTYAATCIDDTARLNQRKVIGQYTGSASDIVIDLVAAYAPWVTTAHVVPALPLVDGGITFTNQDLTDALTQVAKRIGAYWKLDYFGDLHFFLTSATGAPAPLTNASPRLQNVQVTHDVSQVVTRVYVEGGGGVAIAEVPVAETILPVSETSWYGDTGGVVVSGPQRIAYTGFDVGGGGSLVGTGRAPDAAPNGELADGAGIEDGLHAWAYTYVTASGESIPSPLLTLDVGTVPAPTNPPIAGAPVAGSGVTSGAHTYAVTYKTAAGETTGSPLSNSITTGPVTTGLLAAPGFAPTLALTGGSSTYTHTKTIAYAVTFTNAAGETTPGPTGTIVTTGFDGTPTSYGGTIINVGTGAIAAGSYQWFITMVTAHGETPAAIISSGGGGAAFDFRFDFTSPAANAADILRFRFYRTTNGGAIPLLIGQTASTSDTVFIDNKPDAALGAAAPTLNPTYRSVALSAIALGPPGTTGRKVYATDPGGAALKLLATLANNTATTATDANPVNVARLGVAAPSTNTTATTTNYNVVPVTIPPGPANATHVYLYRTAAGGSQLKLVTAIITGTLLYNDAIPDGTLGVNIPVTNTADANRASLTGIGTGPAGTTDRKLYRTVAAGSQLKLVTTIAGNVTTIYTDLAADAALGANAPVADTSGLPQPTGQVLAGATVIPVANTIDFPAAGWAIISGDQAIRYTGKTGTTLTGVTGIGATVGYNSTIKAAPQLTGTSGILYTLPKGQDVNLLVQVDDVGAQLVLGAILVDAAGAPTDGIVEAYVQDRRLSGPEALARGQAYLDLYSDIETTIRYRCQDPLSKAGFDITVALTDPMPVTGVFKIQSVEISFTTAESQMFPWYDVTASSTRFSFEDLLRQVRPTA